MNKFKVGDKVETPFGIGEITIFNYFLGNDKSYKVRLNYKMDDTHVYEYGKPPLINFTEKEIKTYKSAHEKLLELGFNFWDNSNGLQYDRKEIGILIDKETKTYEIYWVVDDMAYSVDLELSKILTQYLEELEKENDIT